MPTKQYGALEQYIIEVMNRDGSFTINSAPYKVLVACKPRPSFGECKTDVYILAEDIRKNKLQLKISVKSEVTNEFQENKVSAEKAEAYFGTGWVDIVSRASESISEVFEKRPLIYITGKHPTQPNSITLGWKLEIASKPRALSVKAPLSDQEIRDYVYKGTNQNDDKRNARVNGFAVSNAGVAEYLLATSIPKIRTADDIVHQMVLIDEAVLPETHLIFTANNYRTDVDKADGPRPLAVYIRWEYINNKLCPMIMYDAPLIYTGERDMKPILLSALRKLAKNHPCEFDVLTDLPSEDIVCY